jgi:acetylornithine deacetylase/succinyl-diaminopimelate desuccinylase family protein
MKTMEPLELRDRFQALLPRDQPVELAKRLIGFPSENPPGKEKEISEFLSGLLVQWGFEVKETHRTEGRPNLAATMKFGNGGRRLIFNGHLDVVPAGDPGLWNTNPYEGVIRDGCLFGRGAADTKGGVAAMLYGALLVKEAGIDLGDAELVLHLVSDEESGGDQGSGHLASVGIARGDAAIVVEPTDLNIVIAQKGTLWFRITMGGVAAHASTPHLGVNAISRMAALIPILEGMSREARHPLLGEPTINVGTIKGGSKVNSVPDLCAIELDRRCLPGEKIAEIEKELAGAIAGFAAGQKGAARFERIMFAEPCEVSPSERIVETALRNQERVLGKRTDLLGSTGFTDARIYVLRAGTPAILLGPGNISQAHTVNEFVSVESLRLASVLFAMITADFFGALRQ